jgi:hypothetical protein
MPTKKKLAPGQFRVEDDVFRYVSKRGALVEIDLDIPIAVFDRSQADEDASDEKQFEAVREWLGPDFDAGYSEMGALERTRFLNAFYASFAKAAEIPLGESLSSSDS